MENYTLTYLDNLRVKAIHERSQAEIITDAPVDNQGQGSAFSPTDLLCTALASCMITIIGIIAKRNAIDIKGLKAELAKYMSEEPRRVKEIVVKLHFPKKEYSQKEKIIFRRAVEYCPVALSLHPDIKKTIHFVF